MKLSRVSAVLTAVALAPAILFPASANAADGPAPTGTPTGAPTPGRPTAPASTVPTDGRPSAGPSLAPGIAGARPGSGTTGSATPAPGPSGPVGPTDPTGPTDPADPTGTPSPGPTGGPGDGPTPDPGDGPSTDPGAGTDPGTGPVTGTDPVTGAGKPTPPGVVPPPRRPAPRPLPTPAPDPDATLTPGAKTPAPPVQDAPADLPGDPDAPVLVGQGGLLDPAGVGRRYTVTLTVTEPLAAVEIELRLGRADATAGAMAWSTLPGARVTLHQDGSTVLYRFAPQPGEDVQPGLYTFTVQDARAATPGVRDAGTGWTASGFALRHPHAVVARGGFTTGAPQR
ncbi:hypothetical protein GCM10009665_78500 [Kitasatospora nipponensis]|uniref:Uncharacterized protein n=1 Tax=Kitasatospora nipponensis TaxID=258049 RepID=A0ABN1TCJ1_9ACTN